MDLKKAEESTNEAHEDNKLTKRCLDQAKITSTLKSIGLSRKGNNRTLYPHEKPENV